MLSSVKISLYLFEPILITHLIRSTIFANDCKTGTSCIGNVYWIIPSDLICQLGTEYKEVIYKYSTSRNVWLSFQQQFIYTARQRHRYRLPIKCVQNPIEISISLFSLSSVNTSIQFCTIHFFFRSLSRSLPQPYPHFTEGNIYNRLHERY